MKSQTAPTDQDFNNKGYSRFHNEVTSYIPADQIYKPFVEELHTEIVPLTSLIEVTLKHLFYLKDNYLQQASAYYLKQRTKGSLSSVALEALFERLQEHESAINYMFALIARIQKYLPEIVKFENAEQQAKEYWGKLPLKYMLTFEYDLTKENPNSRLFVTLYR